MDRPEISVVVLAYGEEDWLGDAVASVLASEGVSLELVVVDNGCTSDAVAALPDDPRLRVLVPPTNLGFAAGVNFGAQHCAAPLLAMVNSDAEVRRDCLALLQRRLEDPAVGIAGAMILLADKPGFINSAGNPLHVLGLSWAGHLGEPLEGLGGIRPEASVSGACMVVRRDLWDRLRGFPPEFFAYFEDLDLCWRTRLLGLRVDLVPEAQALHHYEFSRNDLKMYLLERNRLAFVLTTYGSRTLLLLALPLAAFEIAMVGVAAVQGWGRQKVRGWWWIATHTQWLRERRRAIQTNRVVPDRHLERFWMPEFDSSQMPLPRGARPLQSLLTAWWTVAKARI
ncbi:MAG: glycosyltransferase family 2 protein [Actinobacteria bacterium]|nr:glycosyltransferase family 2 protein [Actinomycetota bacterium]